MYKIDLTGQRFGRLIAESSGYDKRQRAIWHCRCDCGGSKEVLSSNLTRGNTRSCGCLHRDVCGANRVDLTGQRFGRLIVARDTGRRRRKWGTVWQCRCDCGGSRDVLGELLTRGHTRSCGCLVRDVNRARAVDLTGQRFGWLIAVADSGQRRNGHSRWECRCDCGQTTVVRTGKLTGGHTRSCGCLHTASWMVRFNTLEPEDIPPRLAALVREVGRAKRLCRDTGAKKAS